MLYNDQTMKNALAEVSTFNANFGGTEIYKPLEFAINMKIDNKY